jgi:hypothetical protein
MLKRCRKRQEDLEKQGFLPVFDYITHMKEKAEKTAQVVAKAAESAIIQSKQMLEESDIQVIQSTQELEESSESDSGDSALASDTQGLDSDLVPGRVGHWQVHTLESDTEDLDLVSMHISHMQVCREKSLMYSDS